MKLRTFGRLGWQVSEIGYGMWGMGGWSGSDDRESMASLELAADRGVNFFDTAQAYGEGHSEQLLAMLLKGNSGKRIFAATKVPPMNRQWPALPKKPLAQRETSPSPRPIWRRLPSSSVAPRASSRRGRFSSRCWR